MKRKERFEKVEELIDLYKETSEDLYFDSLLSYFEPIIVKVVLAIKKQNSYDAKTKKMIAAMARILKNYLPEKESEKDSGHIQKCFSYLASQPFEELKADATLAFFLIVNRFERQENSSFCGYVSQAFYMEIGRLFGKKLKSIYGVIPYGVDFGDNSDLFIDGYDFNCIWRDKTYENAIEDELSLEDELQELSSKWINEPSENKAFSDLDPLEKSIILYSYENKITDKIIARELGFHINKVNTIRNNTVTKIRKKLNIDYLKRNRNSGCKMDLSVLREMKGEDVLVTDLCGKCCFYPSCLRMEALKELTESYQKVPEKIALQENFGYYFYISCGKRKNSKYLHFSQPENSIKAEEVKQDKTCSSCAASKVCYKRKNYYHNLCEEIVFQDNENFKEFDFKVMTVCDDHIRLIERMIA